MIFHDLPLFPLSVTFSRSPTKKSGNAFYYRLAESDTMRLDSRKSSQHYTGGHPFRWRSFFCGSLRTGRYRGERTTTDLASHR